LRIPFQHSGRVFVVRGPKTRVTKPTEEGEMRRAILDSAERMFARDGFRATRTETIADHADVSKALIYYYFGTKQALYQEVLGRIRHDLELGLGYASLQKMKPRDALIEHLTRLLRQSVENPHRAPLFALENIQNDGKYYGGPAASMLVLVSILERGTRARVFRAVDARHAALIIMGACLHYFNVMNNARMMWPPSKNPSALLREHTASVLDFVLTSLDAGATPKPARRRRAKQAAVY
jgi:TetR/AcrR family transcriptional regulator